MNRNRSAISSSLRRQWTLKPNSIFLNHGSFGACPAVILKLQNKFRAQMEAEPVQFLWRHYDERLDLARNSVARFVGARPRDLVLVTNATAGVNAVLRSIELHPGDEILTTDHNYNACHNVLIEAARRARAKVVVARVPFPVGGSSEILQAVLDAVSKRTRLALIDHVTSSTALIFPVQEIVRELSQRGVPTLIDGAHAPGMLPVNLSRLAPAYYTANLHKWVCAPKGSAFLWVHPEYQEGLQPAVISHGNNTPRPHHSHFQDRFDWAGTSDPCAWFCLPETIRWFEETIPGGWPAIRETNHQLIVRARDLLCTKLDVAPPCPVSLLGSMATVLLPVGFQGRQKKGKIDLEQLRLYDKHGIEVPFFRRGRPETRYFRISAHLYNHLGEYDHLGDVLKAFRW